MDKNLLIVGGGFAGEPTSRADDEPLHPMPLYHSAGMHVMMLPYLAVGATNHVMESPDVPEILRRVEGVRDVRLTGRGIEVTAPLEIGEAINRALVDAQLYASAIVPRQSSLEDVFLELTEKENDAPPAA